MIHHKFPASLSGSELLLNTCFISRLFVCRLEPFLFFSSLAGSGEHRMYFKTVLRNSRSAYFYSVVRLNFFVLMNELFIKSDIHIIDLHWKDIFFSLLLSIFFHPFFIHYHLIIFY